MFLKYSPALLYMLALLPGSLVSAQEPDLSVLFEERVKSVVAVECFIQHEVDREPAIAVGVVFDDEGRIVLLDTALPSWLPPDRFKDFKVHQLGVDDDGFGATYLGQDYLTGYHFVQIEESARDKFVSVQSFGMAAPKRGELLWGIGVMGDQWAFLPYFLSGRLSGVEPLPWLIGFTDVAVASPGSAVFDAQGHFAGWAGRPVTQEKVVFMQGERFNAAIQDIRESSMFLTAEEFAEQVKMVPSRPEGDPRPWLGISGVQPLDREAARFLGLEQQGALVVSDIIEEGPAQKAGLQSRDIVVALDGEPLPKYKPDFVVSRFFELEMMKKGIGQTVPITVIRGDQKLDLEATLIQQPTPLKEAERHYFSDLGLAIRQFTLFDGISRRVMKVSDEGVIVDFVKPNSPLNSAGLVPGDWVKEVDGKPIANFAEGEAAFEALEDDPDRKDFVLLVSRANETKVLRVKRK